MPSEHYTEDHKYSHYLQSIKLKSIDKAVLDKYRDAYKKKELSEIMNMSQHSVSNCYTRVNALFKEDNISTSCLIAGILEMHTMELRAHEL